MTIEDDDTPTQPFTRQEIDGLLRSERPTIPGLAIPIPLIKRKSPQPFVVRLTPPERRAVES